MRSRPLFFVALLAGAALLLAVPAAAEAQRAGRIPKIGVVAGASPSAAHPVRGFQQGLRELGYTEGQNIIVEYRWAYGNAGRIPGLVADLIRLNVDVILAGNTAVAVAAKKATTTIPIVTTVVSNPVERGLIASIAAPGGNVTGMVAFSVELTAKQLELLRETLPAVSRVAVLWNPGYEASPAMLRSAKVSADALGLQIQELGVRSAEEYEAAFAAMIRRRAEALLVVADPMFFRDRARLAELAARANMPAMYGINEHAEAGGLMNYSADYNDLYRRAAYFVDKILKGANPAALPVEQPVKFRLVINLKTARALGLTIPPSLLLRADQLIE